MLFKSRPLTRSRWVTNPRPKQISFPAYGSSVLTCLIFSCGGIISASDDHSIHIHSPHTGDLIRSLEGHESVVWALPASRDTLVSGSTDRTARIWDLNTGICTHVFGGHTSNARCLAIVKPEMVEMERKDGTKKNGPSDHSWRAWALPMPDHPEYKPFSMEEDSTESRVCFLLVPWLFQADGSSENRMRIHTCRAMIMQSGLWRLVVELGCQASPQGLPPPLAHRGQHQQSGTGGPRTNGSYLPWAHANNVYI
jgi:WD domain, G-beta repeat